MAMARFTASRGRHLVAIDILASSALIFQLRTSHMPTVLFIDCWPAPTDDGDWRDRFRAIPPVAADCGVTLVLRHHLDLPAELPAPAGIILSGSAVNLYRQVPADDQDGCTLEAFAGLVALLGRLPAVPVLGLCFGHQFLAFAAGGTLGLMPNYRRSSDYPVRFHRQHALISNLTATTFVESHQMVVLDPGPEYEVLAESEDGIEAIGHLHLPRVGVQFHPEYFERQASPHGRQVLVNWFAGLRR